MKNYVNVLEHLKCLNVDQIREYFEKFIKNFFKTAKIEKISICGDRLVAFLTLENSYSSFIIDTNTLASCYIEKIYFLESLKIEIISYPIIFI